MNPHGPADGPHTLGQWLTHSAASHADKVAVHDRGVTTTYAVLEERSSRLAAGLRRAGYGVGDRVATLTANSVDHVVAFLACAKAGVAIVPLSWRSTVPELADNLRVATPELLLADPDRLTQARAARGLADCRAALTVLGSSGVEATVPTRPTAPGEEWPDQRPVADDDPLLIVFTSGSESRPKAAVLTHATCFWTNLALGSALPLDEHDVVLATLPQFHVAAWNVQPLLALWRGATVVLEQSSVPSRVLHLIEERRVTAMMGVPTQYRQLADDPFFADADLSSLTTVVVGGAPMPADLVEVWAERGVLVHQGYGLSEAGPNVLVDGCPYPYVELRLVDPATGEVVPGDGRGELQVRGPALFAGYLGDPAATARALVDGWLRTGDLAVREAGGYRVVDRLKSIYITGGENVSPAEVEAVLLAHSMVAEAAVVSVPHALWGEVGVAFVQPVEGVVLSPEELLDHVRGRLARFKIPHQVQVVPELPRTGIGKLARSRLRDLALDAHQETS